MLEEEAKELITRIVATIQADINNSNGKFSNKNLRLSMLDNEVDVSKYCAQYDFKSVHIFKTDMPSTAEKILNSVFEKLKCKNIQNNGKGHIIIAAIV